MRWPPSDNVFKFSFHTISRMAFCSAESGWGTQRHETFLTWRYLCKILYSDVDEIFNKSLMSSCHSRICFDQISNSLDILFICNFNCKQGSVCDLPRAGRPHSSVIPKMWNVCKVVSRNAQERLPGGDLRNLQIYSLI